MKEENTKTFKKPVIFINEALEIYKQNYHTLLAVSAIIIAPSILVSVFSEKTVMDSVVKTFGMYSAIFFGVVTVILFVIISSWGQIALMYSVKERENKLSPSQAFSFAWKKLLSYWWISFLLGFLLLGGFSLFIIPGFLFALWFSTAYYVLVVENEKGMNALLKSREYVKGKAWSVLWRFIVLYFFNFLFAIPIGMIFGEASDPWGPMLSQNVFSFFVVPFNIIYSFLMYKNLSEMRGEVASLPDKKTKGIFLLIGIFGLLLPLIFVVLTILFYPLVFSHAWETIIKIVLS